MINVPGFERRHRDAIGHELDRDDEEPASTSATRTMRFNLKFAAGLEIDSFTADS